MIPKSAVWSQERSQTGEVGQRHERVLNPGMPAVALLPKLLIL